jgi:hypothetical protein
LSEEKGRGSSVGIVVFLNGGRDVVGKEYVGEVG